MGGRLSKKKKGCYGDHTDEAADEPSETPIDQKDEETDGNQGTDCADTLKGEHPDSNGLQSEGKSKKELQGGETVNQVKEAAEASKDQTKDGRIFPDGEDLKLAQTKGAESETEKTNGEGTPSKPEVFFTVSAEPKPEETKPAIVEKTEPEICSNNTPENKAKEVSANIQSTNGANENPTGCITRSDKNVNGAAEPLCFISTENICNVQSVKEKDPVCLNAAKFSENSACSKPPVADILCQDASPSALHEPSNKKNNSEGAQIDAGPLKSSEEAHPVSCEDTFSKQILDDSNAIADHEHVAPVRSKSDDLVKSTESHKDEGYNCELLNTAQETKREDRANKPTECFNTENECRVKLDTCTTPGEDICVTTGDDECLAQNHQGVPKDQTTSVSETKPDLYFVPKLEDSISLKGTLPSPKQETQAETEIVDEATVVTVTESETILAQNEVTSAAVQKASLESTLMKIAVMETSTSPVETEPTAEVQTSVAQVQLTSEVESSVTQMEVEVTAEMETCMPAVEEEFTTEPEASVSPVQEVSLAESLSKPAPVGNISSSELETCMAQAKATPAVQFEDSVALKMLSPPSESEVAIMEEASLEKVEVDEVQVEVASPTEMEKGIVETEVSPAKLEDGIAQREVITPAEPEEGSTQGEAESQEPQGESAVPEEAAYLCKEQGDVTEAHIPSPAEVEDCVVNGEGTSPPEIDASLTLEHMSSTTNAQSCESPDKLDCPAEPEISAMPIEHEEHVTKENTLDMDKIEAHATSVAAASSNPDACKDLAEVMTIKDSDIYNAQENQGEGQESTEEKYSEETDSKLCPETVNEIEINVENIKENEMQNVADLKIEVSSEYVIHDEVPQNCEVVLNGDS